jgi:hypothetical protein
LSATRRFAVNLLRCDISYQRRVKGKLLLAAPDLEHLKRILNI